MASNNESMTQPSSPSPYPSHTHRENERRLPNNAPQKVHQRKECGRAGQAVGPLKYAKHFLGATKQDRESDKEGGKGREW